MEKFLEFKIELHFMSLNWCTHMCLALSDYTVASIDTSIKFYKT